MQANEHKVVCAMDEISLEYLSNLDPSLTICLCPYMKPLRVNFWVEARDTTSPELRVSFKGNLRITTTKSSAQ